MENPTGRIDCPTPEDLAAWRRLLEVVKDQHPEEFSFEPDPEEGGNSILFRATDKVLELLQDRSGTYPGRLRIFREPSP